MSKIYEALLRAEQDRAEQDQNGAATRERKLPAFPSEKAPAPESHTSPDRETPHRETPHHQTQHHQSQDHASPANQAYANQAYASQDYASQDYANQEAPIESVHAWPVASPPVIASSPATAPSPTSFAAALAASAAAIASPLQPPAYVAPPVIPALAELPPDAAFAAPLIAPIANPAFETPAPALPPRPSDDRFFSPDKVRRVVWEPALSSLPALEERGAPVEQFRSLRSRMFEFRDLNRLKSIMVSSGLPQEGKSFITVNLAISFARHKASRVLLIDGDMRRSTLHKLLGADGSIGLSEYLAGNAGLLDIMQQIEPPPDNSPARLGLASLTFIPGGSESDKAADLSGNPRFTQLMQTVAPHFDWIVVDSAPVNVVADGVNLARACDGVLLVARGGVTRYETAQRALMELKASTILGFVLNAVEALPQTGGYYGYESYDSAI